MALTFVDIYQEVGQRLRIDYTDAALLTLLKRWINQTLQDVHSRYNWFWSLDRQIVQTVADITDGTVSVAAGGTAVTGVGTSFTSADVGKFIQFPGSDDWYKVSAVASTLACTLEKPYTQTTALSAGTYVLRKFFYSVPDADKVLSVVQAIDQLPVRAIHFKDWDNSLTFADSTGKARFYFLYGKDSSGDLQFQVYPFADEIYNLEIRYKKKATELANDADTPDIPAKWREVLIDGAMVKGLEYIAVGHLGQANFNPSLIGMKKADYERGIANMLKEAEPNGDDYHPQIISSEVDVAPLGPHLPWTLTIPQD